MTRCLITGGAGFIGFHLAKRLSRDGWAVDLADNFSRGRRDEDLQTLCKSDRVRVLDGDLGDRAFLETLGGRYDFIFHFAAILGVQNVLNRPYDVLDANVALTLASIAIARRQRDLRRLVFASTSEVYAGTLDRFGAAIPTSESTPITLPPLDNPRTSYMLSKIYGEALCRQSGCAVTMVRPHNVYGPRMGNAHVIPQLLERAHAAPDGGVLEVFSVEHTRTFCFIDDAIEIILRLALSEASAGQTVNVGTQAPEIRMGRLAEIVAATVGKRLVIVPRPPTLGSPPRRAPDMALCARLTDYCSRVDLEEGLAETYSWYKGKFS